MKNILKKYFWYFIFIILSVFLIFSSDSKKSSYSLVENKLLEKLTPVFSSTSFGLQWFRSIRDEISLFINQKKQLEELYEKNSFLEHYYYLYKLALAENETLKEEINYTKQYQHKFITGKIIAKNNDSTNQEILINLGTDDSIEKGQWVLARNQLFGRIIETNKNNSRILLISSPISRVPAMGVDSREKFVVGGLTLNHFACLHLKDRNNLKEGELVITNSLDIEIPEGMIIGVVIKENDIFYIKPNFNLDKAEYIQVVKHEIRK